MNWFSWLFAWTLDSVQDVRDRVVDLIGIPISFRIIFHPEDLLNAMKRNNIHQDLERIKMIVGPDDNIIGQYHISGVKKGTVEIDVGEIVQKLGAKDPDPATIDRIITNTFAHELRHRWQEEKFGKFLILADRIIIFFGIVILGIYFGVRPAAVTSAHLFSTFVWWKVVLGVACLYGCLVLFKITTLIAKKCAYRYCWSEIDARRFAKRAESDPDWQKVIDVQFALTVPFPLAGRTMV